MTNKISNNIFWHSSTYGTMEFPVNGKISAQDFMMDLYAESLQLGYADFHSILQRDSYYVVWTQKGKKIEVKVSFNG